MIIFQDKTIELINHSQEVLGGNVFLCLFLYSARLSYFCLLASVYTQTIYCQTQFSQKASICAISLAVSFIIIDTEWASNYTSTVLASNGYMVVITK